jgi:TatD DNase family protein
MQNQYTNDDSHFYFSLKNSIFFTFDFELFNSPMRYIDIHSHRENRQKEGTTIHNILLNKNEQSNGNTLSVGWHPWEADSFPVHFIEQRLIEMSSLETVVAIGECGLDKATSIPLSTQNEVLKLHIHVASKKSKPLILHCVRAYNEILELLKAENYSGKFVFHAYNGNIEQTMQLIKTKAFFSFGKSLLNLSVKQVEVFKSIPLDRLFLETDMSDIPIEKIYRYASEILGITENELATKLETNYQEMFT